MKSTRYTNEMAAWPFMTARSRCVAWALAAWISLFGVTAMASVIDESAGDSRAEADADAGSVLFRAGEISGAMELWIAALEAGEGSADERARLAYNLGVATQAKDDPLAAASWYEVALRLRPRMGDARHNRELARADAGLGPAHGDGMTAAGARFASMFSRPEAEWLALGGALLFALAGLLEAFRGRSMRKAVWISLALQPVFFGPMLWHVARGAESMHMVIEPGATSLYSLPDFGGKKVGVLEPGDTVVVTDDLPGWSKVQVQSEGRWVQSEKLMRLDW